MQCSCMHVSVVCGCSQSCRAGGPAPAGVGVWLQDWFSWFLLHWASASDAGLEDRCCTVVILPGRSCRSLLTHSLTSPARFFFLDTTLLWLTPLPTHLFFHIFILTTSGLTYWESETETLLIDLAKLQPLPCGQSALFYLQEAGSDSCELSIKTAEEVKEEIKESLRPMILLTFT